MTTDKIKKFITGEFKGWGKYERIIFPFVIVLIALISISAKDTPLALISALCGITATITAGKGKISCYGFGMAANICYSCISFNNRFWGHLCLNMLYYFPMQFVGIAKWKKHLKKETQEIYKTKLTTKEKVIYSLVSAILIAVLYFILLKCNDQSPLKDSVTTVISIVAFILAVKRCIEQWYIWAVVNGVSAIMWFGAYLNGSHCLATVLMWTTYFILGFYFLCKWKKELNC